MLSAPRLLGLMLVSCAALGATDRDTHKFRTGEAGYSGATDVAITSSNIEGVQQNGATVRAEKLPCTLDAAGGAKAGFC
ncbi:MAG: hypothetical protein IPJ98_03035 [Bryobacterales bacterium]|nr:hypothetical protein [Bryobacterales bacterium]